jgi:hypothetical protein
MNVNIYLGEKVTVTSDKWVLEGELISSNPYHVRLTDGEHLIMD